MLDIIECRQATIQRWLPYMPWQASCTQTFLGKGCLVVCLCKGRVCGRWSRCCEVCRLPFVLSRIEAICTVVAMIFNRRALTQTEHLTPYHTHAYTI